MRKAGLCCLVFCAYCLFHFPVFADYVLPYPSFMPGNRLYTVSRMLDYVENWWYFGSIAHVKYHLKLSDKYLVEAKTLFEYKQYLLGVDALRRSTRQFQLILEYIRRGATQGKDMTAARSMVGEAAGVHRSCIEGMKQTSPETFQWVPEKSPATSLLLHVELEAADQARQAVVNEMEK